MWVGTNEVTGIYLGTQSVKKIYRGTEVLWEEPSDCPCLCFTANTAGSTVKLYDDYGYDVFTRDFKYSRNGKTWATYPYADSSSALTITLTNVGDKVYFKGNNPNGLSTGNMEINANIMFSMTGSISASGNIMSLIDDGACTCTTIPNDYCFATMFGRCASLTTAPALPATTLAKRCYYGMFDSCTSLTTPPALPVTTLTEQCYYAMFQRCTNLTTAPTLPATTLASECYAYMFWGCTSLIVSDSSGSGYSNTWRIPTSGTFTNTNPQYYMFYNCATGAGRSSPAMAGASGASYTYYTQNTPV